MQNQIPPKFKEILDLTYEKLDSTLLALANARAKDDQYFGVVTVWINQFETLIAEARNEHFEGIGLLGDEIIVCLQSMQESSSDLIKRYGDLLRNWINQVVEYLESDNTQRHNNIENLLSPVPSEYWPRIKSAFAEPSMGTDDMENQALVLILDGTIEELRAISSEWNDTSSNEFSLMFSSIIDDIAITSEMMDYNGLLSTSQQLAGIMNSDSSALLLLSQEQARVLLHWLESLLSYLQKGLDIGSLNDAGSILPENEQSLFREILALPKSDSTSSAVVLSDDEEQQIRDELPAADNDFVNVYDTSTILGMLSQELAELSGEMSELLDKITKSTSSDKQKKIVTQYLMLVERIAETADALELDGLKTVCDFVSRNFNLAIEKKKNWKASSKLLKAWPMHVINYLNNPGSDNAGGDLINCLQNKKWQKPLNKATARMLLDSFSKKLESGDFLDEQESRETVATSQDVALDISEISSQGLIDAFFQDSPVVASRLSECIDKIANNTSVSDSISAAQRYAHTLKGSAGLLGIKGIANMSHHMEDILEYLHNHAREFSSKAVPEKLLTVLQEATDCIETMLDSMQGKEDYPAHSIRILQDVLDVANQIDRGDLASFSEDDDKGKENLVLSQSEKPNIAALAAADVDAGANTQMQDSLYVPIHVIDNMFKLVGELVVMTNRIQDNLKNMKSQGHELKSQDKLFQQQRIELEELVNVQRFTNYQRQTQLSKGGKSTFDSLEMDQYDDLHGTVNGLIESVVDKNEINRTMQQHLGALEELVVDQRRLNSDLQQIVMSARMVSVNTVVPRMQRTVRQTARNTGKKVNLVIVGKDLLLDCDILSKLTDPILHLLRNAVDHGIESMAERERGKKSVSGEITLKFSQTGNRIEVVCMDDGRGLDYKRIKDLAVEKNMVSKKAKLDKFELAKLIISPGFTTRDCVTQISGRGIGMDVVNTVVQSYGGIMTVGDNQPAGCRVTLRIPISLVTTHSIIVKSGSEIFAIPSNSLQKVIPSQLGGLKLNNGKPWFHDEESGYPAVNLSSLVAYDGTNAIVDHDSHVALLASNTRNETIAVLVDDVLNSDDLVIKGTGRFVPDITGVSGVSIVGDGGVVPVLDLKALLRNSGNRSYQDIPSNLKPKVPPSRKVLIVDDSISVRKSLVELIKDAGYEALVSRNGVEAISMIRKQVPNIVLSDLEMPKMNGLELTSNIRADASLKKLPVIMVTSRTSNKHRQQAKNAGVSEYLTKPYTEDELLDLIESFI